MKHVDVEQAVAEATKIPVKMDRAAKLRHWAKAIRAYGFPLQIFHLLEYWDAKTLASAYHNDKGTSAFTIALHDPDFKAQGHTDGTIAGAMKFFELSQTELHEFSCNCGGEISNEDMAERIEKLAAKTPAVGPIRQVVNGITRVMRR